MGEGEMMHYKKITGKKARHSRTVAVDFDGVLNSYRTKVGLDKQHLLPDPPVDGALEWVTELLKHFNVVVFTCRASFPQGKEAIETWLEKHGFPALPVTSEKPIAHAYVDDRAIPFDNTGYPSVEYLSNFLPWNRRMNNG